VERRVLGGRADGARVGGRLAAGAQAQVPARQQQHARARLAARPARPAASVGRGAMILLDEAARPRVLGVALALGARRRLQELVDGGAQARRRGLVPAGDAPPGLSLGGHLPELLLQLRTACQRALQVDLRRPQAARGRALERRHHGPSVPAQRLLQSNAQPLVLRSAHNQTSITD
jgi:hypothetical protein